MRYDEDDGSVLLFTLSNPIKMSLTLAQTISWYWTSASRGSNTTYSPTLQGLTNNFAPIMIMVLRSSLQILRTNMILIDKLKREMLLPVGFVIASNSIQQYFVPYFLCQVHIPNPPPSRFTIFKILLLHKSSDFLV